MNTEAQHVEQMFKSAVAMHQQGQLEEAKLAYQKLLKLFPNQPATLHLLGVIAGQQNQHQRAVQMISQAIKLAPNQPSFYYNRGKALQELDRLDEALADYQRVIKLKPGAAEAYFNSAVLLDKRKHWNEAVAHYTKVITYKPDAADAYFNRANTLQKLDRLEEALHDHNCALNLKPDYAEAYSNRGNVLRELRRFDEALASYEQAIKLNPDCANIYLNKAVALLIMGDYQQAWHLFEWRWQENQSLRESMPAFTQPRWLGELPLAGKTILLHSEQGMGDSLQFCRYVPLVKAQGATVLLQVEHHLFELFRSLAGVDALFKLGETVPPFDYYCSLMSLPLACGTRTLADIPNSIPYLSAPADKVMTWREQLGTKTKPRVGLVWHGGFRPHQPEVWEFNKRRNLPFELVASLNDLDISFYSLQKGEPAESEALRLRPQHWSGDNLYIFTEHLHNFADTAALISQLDLVISVDTSVGHLAGALGKPVWLLILHDACWRWLWGRDDSPWYPQMRLFRQPRVGDWDSVIKDVHQALAVWLDEQ